MNRLIFVMLFLVVNFVSFSSFIIEDFDNLDSWGESYIDNVYRHSEYKINGGTLKAVSNSSASAIIHDDIFSPYSSSKLSWRWKVKNIYKKGDAKQKKGYDFPLKIYIIFKYDPSRVSLVTKTRYRLYKKLHGHYPPHSKLVYVWDTRNMPKEIFTSPFENNSRGIIMQAGRRNLNKWIEEEVNILDDYIATFGEYPPNQAQIAIMNDSDDTGETSTSYIDYLYITQ